MAVTKLKRLSESRLGATAVEYGLIAALISVALIAGLGGFGNTLNGFLVSISNAING